MAMRSVLSRGGVNRLMESSRGAARRLSDGTGRILSEEERAAENVYIKKMEREKMEKLKKKAEQEKAAKEKGAAAAEKNPGKVSSS